MKKYLIVLSLLLFISGIFTQSSGQEGKKTMLFNGKNIRSWVFQLRDASVDPAGVFTVDNGVIRIKGEPFGYMRTKKAYSDYLLHLEWKWPVEPTNSGVFIHAQLPDTIWPRCFECQLKAGSAGDFVCMNGSDMKERTDKSVRVVKKFKDSSEKAPGEWNTLEIRCKGNEIEIHVNGVLQNRATETNISSGYICLQSEGKDIEFRNIWLTKLR